MNDGVDATTRQGTAQRPDPDTSATELLGPIHRIARLSGDALERTYGALGTTRADVDVLSTLRRAGPPFRMSPSRLAGILMVTTGGMTGRLDRLERAGRVRRYADPHDRRSLQVELTADGRALVDAAVAAGQAVQHEMLADLPAEQRRTHGGDLRTMLASVESHTPR